MKPIRVLQVVTTMERAGLETMIMNYYRHIDREKVQFDFLRHREGPHAYDDEIKAMGGRIYSVPPFNPLNTNGYLSELDEFFSHHHDYKVVHSHLDCLSSVPLKYAKKYGVETRIAHSHVMNMTFDKKYPVRLFYKMQIPKYATDLFACSEEAGRWMFGKREFSIVKNAIDLQRFAFDSNKRNLLRTKLDLDNKFVICHVGRFDAVKNHAFLISLFKKLEEKDEESRLILIGEGNKLQDIKALVKQYALAEKVLFLGSIDNVYDILQSADAFVFPSLYEGLGISLIEAQAAGLPCYASKDCVPETANLTGKVNFLSLKDLDKWVDCITNDRLMLRERDSDHSLIIRNGYDIATEAKKLQAFYLGKAEED